MPKKTRRFESAPQDRLGAVGHLAPRFFREVVGWDYAEVLVTDESDLRDYADLTGDRRAEVAGMLDRMAAQTPAVLRRCRPPTRRAFSHPPRWNRRRV